MTDQPIYWEDESEFTEMAYLPSTRGKIEMRVQSGFGTWHWEVRARGAEHDAILEGVARSSENARQLCIKWAEFMLPFCEE